AVASGSDGAFMVAWESYQDGDRTGVFGRRYDSAGHAAGTEFQVNTYTTSYQRSAAVASGVDAGFVVVWEGYGDGGGYGVFGQRYDSAGQAAGTGVQVNRHTASNKRSPPATAGAAGG